MFKVVHKGNFEKTMHFLKKSPLETVQSRLNGWGKRGIQALSQATPKDSGLTSDSWDYEIIKTKNRISIIWTNNQKAGEVPVAIILQYGHGTRNGGYVEGVDYINPAMRPVFDEIVKEASILLRET